MKVIDLKLDWLTFQRRIEMFEEKKESELKSRFPELTDCEINRKIEKMVDKHFKKESDGLLQRQFALSKQN